MKRGLVFFHYFENGERYRENLVFFLSTAYRKDLDFIVVLAGSCSVQLPERPNISYFATENRNNDFGGYAAAIASYRDRIDDYDFFVFVNSSVRGPFFAQDAGASWVSAFVDRFSDDVHLVGSSIAILAVESDVSQHARKNYDFRYPYSHVQTTAYALTPTALKHLVGIGFYDVSDPLDKIDVICRYELGLSQELLRAGWNIRACLGKYNTLDYRQEHTDPNPSSVLGDPLYKRAYFGQTADPYELVFVKTNRRFLRSVQLPWITLRALLRVSDPEILAWPEYRRLRSAYLIRLASVPLEELKKVVVRTRNHLSAVRRNK